jgi:uncharacterized protein YerC
MQDKNYCVYFHRRKDTAEIIYVGEGRKARAKLVRLDKGKNAKHQEIVKTIGVYYEVYKDNLTKLEAEQLEQYLIKSLKEAGASITNVNSKATASTTYTREEFENLFYVDSTSPSGLRWKEDRRNIKDGYILANKDSIACSKKKTTGYWYYKNKASHRIVYALVHGECPSDLTIDHIDCNKDNNSIENLRLLTRSENSSRGNIYKVMPSGEDVSTAKVTNAQVLEMYKLFEEFKTNAEIAELFTLHERYVSLIRHGRRWKKLYKEYGKIFPESFTEVTTTHSQIEEAWYLITLGLTNKDVAVATGIEVSTVSRIRHKKLFKNLIERIENEKSSNLQGSLV